MREKIIFDVDTGEDDALAIALAAGLRDEIDIVALIATAGNVSLDKTLENTLNMAEVLSLDVPVYKGSSGPLLRDRAEASDFHGITGLDGPSFPKRKKQECRGNGILFALDYVLSHPGEITFVSVGPLTDLAVLIKADPEFARSLKRIVIMGGSMGRGNATDAAEFNIYADPEAAEIVFSSNAEVVMMGLDVTLKVILDEKILNKVESLPDSPYKRLFLSQMSFYVPANLKHNHDYPAMHDPCAIAYLVCPDAFRFERRSIHVETKGNIAYGATIAGEISESANVLVGVDADTDAFWSLFFRAFENLAHYMDSGLYF